jgi:DNA-binding XRE family transcriptional regulator
MSEQTFASQAGRPAATGDPDQGPPRASTRRTLAGAGLSSPIAAELRRRRETLRLSVREASRRTGVSHTVICEIESGRRLPTVRTFERLRRGLGLEAPAEILVRPREALVDHGAVVRLAACLWACGGRVALADLAAAIGLDTASIRAQLPLVAPRLAACGISMMEDGVQVRLGALTVAEPALKALGRCERS